MHLVTKNFQLRGQQLSLISKLASLTECRPLQHADLTRAQDFSFAFALLILLHIQQAFRR